MLFCAQSTATNAVAHLECRHPQFFKGYTKTKNEMEKNLSAKRLSSNLPKITDHIGTKKYEKNSAQQVRLEQKVAEMIAKDLQPYSVDDNAGF